MTGLIETMRLWRGAMPLWPWHAARLGESARALGIPLDLAAAAAAVWSACDRGEGVVRLHLDVGGALTVTRRPLPITNHPFRLAVSPVVADPTHGSLYHKTTDRALYDRVARWAAAHACDDALLTNPRGALTEASFANLIVEIDGGWWTPPVEAGLLPGIMRQVLLEAGRIDERALTREDLARARRVWLCNAVRGVWPVEYDPRPEPLQAS